MTAIQSRACDTLCVDLASSTPARKQNTGAPVTRTATVQTPTAPSKVRRHYRICQVVKWGIVHFFLASCTVVMILSTTDGSDSCTPSISKQPNHPEPRVQ